MINQPRVHVKLHFDVDPGVPKEKIKKAGAIAAKYLKALKNRQHCLVFLQAMRGKGAFSKPEEAIIDCSYEALLQHCADAIKHMFERTLNSPGEVTTQGLATVTPIGSKTN